MAELVVRRGRVEPDGWRFFGTGSAGDVPAELPAGQIAVPLAQWLDRRCELLLRGEPVGVWLEPSDAPESLAGDLASLSLVAIRFPKFNEGRGYSAAVVLRRLGYRGELRAFGDLGRDHLFYLARCGFDAFTLRDRENPGQAVHALDTFSVRYQGSADDGLPLFRRRAALRALGPAP